MFLRLTEEYTGSGRRERRYPGIVSRPCTVLECDKTFVCTATRGNTMYFGGPFHIADVGQLEKCISLDWWIKPQHTTKPYPAIYSETNGVPNSGILRIVLLACYCPAFPAAECITNTVTIGLKISLMHFFSSNGGLVSHGIGTAVHINLMVRSRFKRDSF